MTIQQAKTLPGRLHGIILSIELRFDPHLIIYKTVTRYWWITDYVHFSVRCI